VDWQNQNWDADAGMTRMAILRDPFGNWVHLVETRAF